LGHWRDGLLEHQSAICPRLRDLKPALCLRRVIDPRSQGYFAYVPRVGDRPDENKHSEVNFVFELPPDRFARCGGGHTEQNAGVPSKGRRCRARRLWRREMAQIRQCRLSGSRCRSLVGQRKRSPHRGPRTGRGHRPVHVPLPPVILATLRKRMIALSAEIWLR